MEIVRYIDPIERAVRVGVRQGGTITPIAAHDLGDLWSTPASELPDRLRVPANGGCRVDDVMLLPPVDGRTEVWAAGVTYERSRSAREEESSVAEVYDRVYQAERPELFFKSVAWRVVTDQEPVAIRSDSDLNVPEAELALVANAFGEIVGYTVCNDMSSRAIEGENPLYLPQAKVYAGSCALASGIRPAWEVPDAGALGIELTVTRGDRVVWQAGTSTSAMYRRADELVTWLFAEQSFPAGVILSTGTGLVPDMDFSLRRGDVVRIDIEHVGSLTNTVLSGKEAFAWLTSSIPEVIDAGSGRRNPEVSEPS